MVTIPSPTEITFPSSVTVTSLEYFSIRALIVLVNLSIFLAILLTPYLVLVKDFEKIFKLISLSVFNLLAYVSSIEPKSVSILIPPINFGST